MHTELVWYPYTYKDRLAVCSNQGGVGGVDMGWGRVWVVVWVCVMGEWVLVMVVLW